MFRLFVVHLCNAFIGNILLQANPSKKMCAKKAQLARAYKEKLKKRTKGSEKVCDYHSSHMSIVCIYHTSNLLQYSTPKKKAKTDLVCLFVVCGMCVLHFA